MQSKLNEIRIRKNLVGQKIRALRDKIKTEKIRKATGREMYGEIYKPITEGIRSQKEKLSSQLKALPGIKGQLEYLNNAIKDIQTYQGLPQLFQEPQPITGSPEEYEELLREYKKYKEEKNKEISKELTEEDYEKTLEDYEKELGAMSKESEDESEEEFVARPKEFKVYYNKDVDLELLDRKRYNIPQEVFNFFLQQI